MSKFCELITNGFGVYCECSSHLGNKIEQVMRVQSVLIPIIHFQGLISLKLCNN